MAAALFTARRTRVGRVWAGEARKRGPAPKWQQLIEAIDGLPKTRQKIITDDVKHVAGEAGRYLSTALKGGNPLTPLTTTTKKVVNYG